MQQTLYIDSLFIIILVVNYAMLIVTAKICAIPGGRSGS
jgi:hypothetical protein